MYLHGLSIRSPLMCRVLCYSSGEDEGSCGAVAEVVVVGSGVGVYMNVCMCMWCVCHTGEERTTWCPCSPHSPDAGSLPSTGECSGEGSVAGYREEGVKGGEGVRPCLLIKMHLFLSILTFKIKVFENTVQSGYVDQLAG